MLRILLGVFLIILCSGRVNAAEPATGTPEDVLRELHFRSGAISLRDGLATLRLPAGFRFLDNADTQTFLTQVWGNPPGTGRSALGMIVPQQPSPTGPDGWAVVLSYDASGYVSDADAGKIDYDQLMRDMKAAAREASDERAAKGYESIELLGWARPPHYDAVAKKLYWAKRLRFGGQLGETLNYEIRILGRGGVLELNVVAAMEALPSIDQRVESVLAMVDFNKGNTYAEFDPKVDASAGYGLAGLIAGGVLAKAGFFKWLVAMLLASKKLLLVLAVAFFGVIAGTFRRLFGGRKPTSASTDTPTVPGGEQV